MLLASIVLNLFPATNPCADAHVKVVIPLENVEELTEIEGPLGRTIWFAIISGSPEVLAIEILFGVGMLVIL